MRGCLTLALLAALPAWAQLNVEQPWSRATPPGANIGVGFLRLRNAGTSAERVIGVLSPVAGRVQMHVNLRDGEVMKMREVIFLEIPAGGVLDLKPGGAHLMLMDLKRPLKEGEHVPLTLMLEQGGELKVDLPVQALGARRPSRRH